MFRRGLVRGKAAGTDRKNEPEYEEVGPPTGLRKNQDKRGDGHHCDLCGSFEAAVRCDRCGSQAFCLSCDDMYHRHPRRSAHVRKAVDSLNSAGGGVRPPLPPKGEGQGAPPPQPPPRKNKRGGFLSNKKEQNYQYSPGHSSYRSASLTNLQSASSDAGGGAGRTIMGSLKRFMGARPLPPTPDQTKGTTRNERPASATPKILTRANTSPSLPNLNEPLTNEDIRAGLPQSVLDINRTLLPNNSTSVPATPASAHAQYPPLQPKTAQSNVHTQSLGRKFSLQQLPQTFDDKRTSMVEGTPGSVPWEGEAPKATARTRSQSVSDDQWAQMMAAQAAGANTDGVIGPTCPPGHTPADMSAFAGATTRRSYNTMGGNAGRSGSSFGRGMVSSASVCDLNSLAQQQSQHGFNNSHAANSFQQLNMMGYNNGMMWGAPCDLCQGAPMYPGHPNASGMKRTASNLSMNLSSVGSDVSGYPWGPPPPHVHHHMPPMYLGYYPGYHPHMGPPPMGSGMGLNMSIPDSMHTFGKVPSSPAPSLRSSSHRSHKSSKSRSFSAADTSGRSSRARKLKRPEESEESRSSSVSGDDDLDERDSKSGHPSSSIAWQCDHCTFINSGGARTCGMCSKTVGSSGRSSRRGSERRRSERRRDRRTDHEDDERDVSDYDNDGVVKSNLSFNIKDSKRETRTKVSGSSKSKSKKKSRRRGSSASESESGSEGGGEDERLERNMRDLRLSSSSSRRRGSDYDGINNKDKDRERERSSRKKEGSSGRFKNRGKSHSERSRTPGRQTPRRASPVDDGGSKEESPESSPPEDGHGHNIPTEEHNGHHSPIEGTIIDPDASEATMKSGNRSRSGSIDRGNEIRKERAPSPPISNAGEENVLHQNDEVDLVPEKPVQDKSRSCSPRLRIRKSKSPARSIRNSKGDVDEPSFANTLDDITTIGTNEVADQDLSQYIDEHLQSTAEQPQAEPQEEIPVINFIRPKTPEEEVVEEQRTVANEPPQAIIVNEQAEIKEPNNIATKDTGQPAKKQDIPDSVYEPRYEPIEEPAQVEVSPTEEPERHEAQIRVRDQNTQEVAVAEADEGGITNKALRVSEVKQGSPMAPRAADVVRSASSGSSLGPGSPPDRDRQYTPLSRSSSDAQFYSPPDSPDLSLSDQLRDVPATSQTQAFSLQQDSRPTNNSQTLRNQDDDYLVTALETMQTAQTGEDLKSSRETIRSSMEQLPYSEEAFEGEGEDELPPPRPASAGAATAPPTDGYESLSFQDALTPSGAAKLPRSPSAQDLLLSSAILGDVSTTEISSGIASLQQEADRQARAAAWSKEDMSEKYMTVEEIITKRRQKVMETQGLQLVQVLRDAEDAGYTSEEVSIALTHCGDKNPLEWLKENWKHMVDTVLTLATNYGHERRVNDIGSITAPEARLALRVHKGNIWAAVTECVEQRQKKFNEIYSRGKFKRADIVKALEKNNGDSDAAFLEVNKSQLQPFLMRFWGGGSSSSTPTPQSKLAQSPAPASSSPVTVEPPREAPTLPKVVTSQESTSSQTGPAKKDASTWIEEEEDEDDDDDDDVFENVYANVEPLREESPPEQIYANVSVASKKLKLVKESVKSKKLAKKAAQNQERWPDTQEEEELFTASETAGVESDEESTIEELLAGIGSPNYYEYFTAVDLEELDDSDDDDDDDDDESEDVSEEDEFQDREEIEEYREEEESLEEESEETETDGEEVEEEEEEESEDNEENDESTDAAFSDAEGGSDQLEAFSDSQSGEGEEEEEEVDDDRNQEQFQPLQFVRKEEANDEENEDQANLEEPGMAQTRSGPVTHQKASVIVGKAIAKAMARETSVRESLSRSVTPEVQETTLTTPEPSEEEDTAGQVTASDSDDEDHLRTLDTIPEEEEISDRTESRVSRSASRRTSSRADMADSPAAGSSPATAPAPSPTPGDDNVATTSKPETSTADATASKPPGKKSKMSDNKTYSIIEMIKAPFTKGSKKEDQQNAPTMVSKATIPGSSGESEEEEEEGGRGGGDGGGEGGVAEEGGHGSAETVSPDDRLKVPNLLVQIEGLKARHSKEPDYQEVRELKEQIQMMRKQLEARMEEDNETRPETPETPQEEQPPKGAVILLRESPTDNPPSPEYEQLQFDRTVRRLLAEGQAGSYEKAELAAQLMNFKFDELDSLQAAEECSSIYTAIQFLQQECELCAEKYPMGKMVSMLQCIHRCCRDCAKTYFTFQIKTKNIRDLRCPFCNEPDLDDCEEIANEYLNNMDILLKNILDGETHELFQRKLRDWTLMKDPNFRWCNKCSSGFIANPRARKLICPDCKDVTCAHCRTTWESAHEGISCDAFAQWKADNDLEVQAQGVAKHLAENGITCPKCKFTYSLAKGGCMHFTCTQCKYEFCSGCGQPFRQGSKCPVGPYCERLGLHAHHPRNCLFYLRDKEPHQLQNLLKDAGITYDTESRQVRDTPGQKIVCLVQEQKELPDGLKDDICGRIVPDGYAGLCRLHYTEYLVEKINTHKLDPVSIFDEADLRVCLRRNGKPVPVRRWESEKLYRDKLIKLIKEHLPLEAIEQ